MATRMPQDTQIFTKPDALAEFLEGRSDIQAVALKFPVIDKLGATLDIIPVPVGHEVVTCIFRKAVQDSPYDVTAVVKDHGHELVVHITDKSAL